MKSIVLKVIGFVVLIAGLCFEAWFLAAVVDLKVTVGGVPVWEPMLSGAVVGFCGFVLAAVGPLFQAVIRESASFWMKNFGTVLLVVGAVVWSLSCAGFSRYAFEGTVFLIMALGAASCFMWVGCALLKIRSSESIPGTA